MTIIVAGTVDVDPARRDEAIAAGRPHIETARAEKGCLHYVWSADNIDPGRIYVFEEWQSTEDLAAHLRADPYFKMRDTIAQFGIRGADTKKYEIRRSQAVYDNTGTPRADFFEE